jgi:hypothetical protein
VLAQIAISLVTAFNNFIAILGVYFVHGIWPLVDIPQRFAILGIFAADLGLGAIFANGIMYIWGVKSLNTHLKVFESLMLVVLPILIFGSGFKADVWLFGLYVAAGSTAIGLFFFATEEKTLRKLPSTQ